MPDRCFQFANALIEGQWLQDVVVCVGSNGFITQVEPAAEFRGQVDERISQIAIPGMVNVHSHAFQRGFAGLSEYRTAERDSFWTWRELMYEFVERITPEQIYETARRLYQELLAHGYTWVGEFHYVHNRPDGRPYDRLSCLAESVVQAAIDAGIGICLLPVLYQRGGFEDQPLSAAQRRFSLSENAFLELIDDLQTQFTATPGVQIGMAFHSLRAVDIDTIGRVAKVFRTNADGPIHIHVSEQTREVADCLAATGRRPLELLLSEAGVDDRWCLIHATHINESELTETAGRGAIVGLCPTTEANLGDGIFPAKEFLDAGGRFAIGSDSHVCTNPRSELRLLEYAQRLLLKERAVLGTSDQSVGHRLYAGAARGGAAAIGVPTGTLGVGQRADLVLLDGHHPVLSGCETARILDRYIFCDAGNPVTRVMIGGTWVAG